jgi:hypothetical protein
MQVVIALVIGAIGLLAPVPTYRLEPAMATETRRPVPEGAIVQPAPPQPPATDEPGDPVGSPPAAASTTSTVAPLPGATEPTPSAPISSSTTVPPSSTTTVPAPAAPDARVVVAEDTRDFDLIGMTLPAAPGTPVLVRTADTAGVWGEWHELEFDAEVAAPAPLPGVEIPQEPDGEKPGAHSDPFWVGDATRYELDMAASDAEAAQVHLVYETSRRVVVAETAPAGADPGGPAIWGREAWGARAPTETPSVASELKMAVVHHTAGTNDYSWNDVPALLRGVQAYHMDANGWNDIAYNFAVDKFGRVWEARAGGVDRAVIGGHARGFNTGTTGVVMLGSYDQVEPSWPALGAVADIISWKFAVHDVDARYPTWFQAGEGSPYYAPGSWLVFNRIIAHRDVGLTACPGAYLYQYLDVFRSSVGARVPSMSPPGSALSGNFVGGGETDLFLRQPGVLNDTLVAGTTGGLVNWRSYAINGDFVGVVGDYDANGYDDIYWYAPGPGTDYIWLSTVDGSFRQAVSAGNSGFQYGLAGDYDGDGDDDILWYAPGPAEENLWVAAGGLFYGALAPQVSSTHAAIPGDYNGDGKDEILWTGNPSWLWETFGAGITFYGRQAAPVIGSFWTIPGDYDTDGDDDIMWYAPGPGADWIWTAQGGQFAGFPAPSVPDYFTNVIAGDYDGNGGEDIVWYSSPGTDWVWRYAGRMFGAQATTNIPLR